MFSFFQLQNGKFQMKCFDVYFLKFVQNIDCEYMVETPPLGGSNGSNECPQSGCFRAFFKCITLCTAVYMYLFKSGVLRGS